MAWTHLHFKYFDLNVNWKMQMWREKKKPKGEHKYLKQNNSHKMWNENESVKKQVKKTSKYNRKVCILIVCMAARSTEWFPP